MQSALTIERPVLLPKVKYPTNQEDRQWYQDSARPWFVGAVAYQVYPRSFYDSNGDGIGDLKGVISKLDYLVGTSESLGIDAIWLSPFYTSPMADFGYDVSDHCNVDPIFGTIDDFKLLIYEAHKRGLRVTIDLIPNHTSDAHSWFKESRSSTNNPKRDWYVWRDPKDNGEAPNNWRSVFGGPAWRYDEHTQQYYLHSFAFQQPDLNWDNPEVREAIKGVMRFWLNLGVDGFRVDAVHWIAKDPEFKDDPINFKYKDEPNNYLALTHSFSRGGKKLYTYLQEMASVLEEFNDSFMVLEAYPGADHHSASEYLKFYEGVNPLKSAPFNFEGINTPWNARAFRGFLDEFQSALKENYLPIYTLGNHDKHRLASRVGPRASRTAAMMLLSLPGMPFIYYGEELGMTDVTVPPEQRKDPWRDDNMSRDPARTPMQWDSSLNAGFTSGKPWLPLSANYPVLNVQNQMKNDRSMLNLYKELIRLRHKKPALRYGNYQPIEAGDKVLGFTRQYKGDKVAVFLNFSSDEVSVALDDTQVTPILSTYMDGHLSIDSSQLHLRPNEGLIFQVNEYA